jgi:hypothetical protein
MHKGIINEFRALAEATFTNFLIGYGFKRESKSVTRYSCCILYGQGKRYISVDANVHPMDGPPYFDVVLGEGERAFPESDWNTISIRQLKGYVKGREMSQEYTLGTLDKLPGALKRAKSDVLRFASEFLNGDTASFRDARAKQNKNRAPYQIYSASKNGYVSRPDRESARLKKKYS